MRRKIPTRRSHAADWCRLIGGLALPVVVLAALGSRFGMLPSAALLPALALGFALALLALCFGIFALADIWKSGAEGARSAIAGIFYATPVIMMLAAVCVAAIVYPRLTDISTDPSESLVFRKREALAAATPPPEAAALQSEAYPDIGPRLYPLPVGTVYVAVRKLAAERGWEVVRDVPPLNMPEPVPPAGAPPDAVDAVLDAKATMTQSRSEVQQVAAAVEIVEPEDVSVEDFGALQAVVTTPIFAFADDVIVQLSRAPQGTRVDMRSASRIGRHDLGQNARRIRRFFADLDFALQPDPNAPVPAAPVAATPVADASAEAAPPAE